MIKDNKNQVVLKLVKLDLEQKKNQQAAIQFQVFGQLTTKVYNFSINIK